MATQFGTLSASRELTLAAEPMKMLQQNCSQRDLLPCSCVLSCTCRGGVQEALELPPYDVIVLFFSL